MVNRAHPLVLVSHRLPGEWLGGLDGRCRLIMGPDTREEEGLAPELRQMLGEAHGLLTLLTVSVNDSLLIEAPELKVVSNMAVGVDNIDLEACTRLGVPVGHTPGVLTEGTADLTMALLLAAARRLPEASRDAKEGRWTTWVPDGWLGADLMGATLGIVGMGKIGAAVARRAQGFGVKILYTSRSRKAEPERELGAEFTTFVELLGRSDFVSLHVPLTGETRDLIDEKALRQMKKSAILLNVARGPVVNSQALFKALRNGWIAAAGLDVTDPEPLPADDPLYSLDNCLIVPHIGSATRLTRRRMAELACDNLLAGIEGRRLPHCANPAVYSE